MLTGLVMPTLQATNPILEMTINMILSTLQVHKTNSYSSIKVHGGGGVGAIFFLQLNARVMALNSLVQLQQSCCHTLVVRGTQRRTYQQALWILADCTSR